MASLCLIAEFPTNSMAGIPCELGVSHEGVINKHAPDSPSPSSAMVEHLRVQNNEEAQRNRQRLLARLHQRYLKNKNISSVIIDLRRCVAAKDLSEGRRLHDYVVKNKLHKDRYVGNLLVEMYCKCGALQDARNTFDNLHRRNSFSWNIMMAGYAQEGLIHDALQLFQEMHVRDVVSWTTMVAAYARAGQMQEALRLFEDMPQRSVISWNVILAGYVHTSKLNEAIILFQHMPLPDVFSWTIMILGYAQEGRIQEANYVFQSMPQKNVVSWNTMIAAYGHQGLSEEALYLFDQMQREGIKPNQISLVSILDVCAQKAALFQGRRMHKYVQEHGLQGHIMVMNALINMFAKCGIINEALAVFCIMPRKNVISWTAIIAAYAQHGYCREALDFFQKMQVEAIMPNKVTIASILLACAYADMINEGFHIFVSMGIYHDTAPILEHWTCMIDIFGRVGLNEAESLINNMPFHADVTSWTSLLGACRIHADLLCGKRAAEHILELDPENDAAYLLLRSIYAAVA